MKTTQTISKRPAGRTGPRKSSRSMNRQPVDNPGTAVSAAQLVRASNRWRENYNPLRGLLLIRIVQLLEASERGDFPDLQWLYRYIEKRFPVLRSLIARRRAALLKLDWDIKVCSELPEGATDEMAEKQKKFLRSRYELISNLREAIKFLALAEFRGFSILNKHRYDDGQHDGAVRELHWLPHWNFTRDGLFGDWYWNERATSGATPQSLGEGNKLDPADFIIRVEEMPINEIAAIAFIRSNLSLKDWDAFVELFGIPGCVVIMPANIPAGKEDEYRSSAEKIAESTSGALPNGADAKFPTQSVRGNAPFKEHLEWQEKDVVLAGTGGKLAMLTAPTGLNSSQGESHEDAFDEIAIGEAKEISEIFQKQFDKPELEAEFSGQPILVYFELCAQDEEDATAIVDRVQKLEGVGYRTDAEEVSEKTGLKLERVQIDTGTNPPADPKNPADPKAKKNPAKDAQYQNRARRLLNAAVSQREFLTAVAADLQPLRERLERILQISDPEILKQKLQAFSLEMDALKADIKADPASAHALTSIITTEFAAAASEAAQQRA